MLASPLSSLSSPLLPLPLLFFLSSSLLCPPLLWFLAYTTRRMNSQVLPECPPIYARLLGLLLRHFFAFLSILPPLISPSPRFSPPLPFGHTNLFAEDIVLVLLAITITNNFALVEIYMSPPYKNMSETTEEDFMLE